MSDPLQAIGQSAINAGTNAIGGIINMAITKTVDLLFGDTPANKKKLMDEYYARVQTIVDNHNLPSQYGGMTPQQRAMQEINEVDNSIVEAVRNLEKARNKSKCGVCRSSLEETINIVKRQAEPIFDATDKIRAMQQLKESGKMPSDAMWDSLSPEEKKEVEKVATKIATPRDFTPHPDVPATAKPAVVNGMPLLIQGEMNDGEETTTTRPVKKPRKQPVKTIKPRRRGRPRKRN